jgi:hypothetical protein
VFDLVSGVPTSIGGSLKECAGHGRPRALWRRSEPDALETHVRNGRVKRGGRLGASANQLPAADPLRGGQDRVYGSARE